MDDFGNMGRGNHPLYTLNPKVHYDGKQLIQAIGRNKWHLSLHESFDGMAHESITLFHKN